RTGDAFEDQRRFAPIAVGAHEAPLQLGMIVDAELFGDLGARARRRRGLGAPPVILAETRAHDRFRDGLAAAAAKRTPLALPLDRVRRILGHGQAAMKAVGA